VAGFDVVPGPPFPTDRYYDDNAWMVLAYVESYEILGDLKWLVRADETLKYVLSGEDDKLGGGIYWKEREKTSKNTCSNGPAAAACLAVYRHMKRPELLAKAKALYAWTKEKLQDPVDGLFWDNLTLDGRMDKTKWSYNSALMLRTAKELSRLRAGGEYRADADRIEKASIARWVRPDGVIDDELQFAHLLFENLDPRKFDAAKSIRRLLGSAGTAGLFGTRWGQEAKAKNMMIIQASAIRALAVHELRSR
jgi:predicted alpha-1,6-mannanase (GH76 family)